MISLRPATVSDAALIADISRQCFYDTFAPNNTKADMNKFMTQQFTKGRLMLEVGARDNYFTIAYDGDEVAGYIKMKNASPPSLPQRKQDFEVARLYAMSNMIGKGVGKILMQHAIDTATGMQKDMIWLGVWEHNRRAINFYESWGYQKFSETKFLLGDDIQNDWLMKKQLKPLLIR